MSEVTKYALYTHVNSEGTQWNDIQETENGNFVHINDYKDAQAKIKELEAEKDRILKIGVEGQRALNDKAWEKNKELEAQLKIATQALEEIRDKQESLTPYTPFAYVCICNEALSKLKGLV